MPLVVSNVITYVCPNCPFKWQFSGEAAATQPADMTDAQLKVQFPDPQFQGLQAGKCPACYTRGVASDLFLSADAADLSVVTVADDAELEAIQVEDLDANGQPIMEQVGEHYVQQFDSSTGQTSVVTVPDYAPKMRPLTDQELADLKLQRDADASTAEAISV